MVCEARAVSRLAPPAGAARLAPGLPERGLAELGSQSSWRDRPAEQTQTSSKVNVLGVLGSLTHEQL